jgi:anti-sigma factor ChrR (cupin superfamily)
MSTASTQPYELLVADAEAMAWIEVYEGFAVKVLRVSSETGHYTILFKSAGGRTEPRHRHLAGADIYVVEGGVEYRPGLVARAGSWMYEPAGALHETRRPIT